MSSSEPQHVSEESLEESAARVTQLSLEIDRQRSGHTQRGVAMNARSAILVSAAGVFAGLGGSDTKTWLDVPLYVLLILAAGLGLWALWPRRGPEVKVGALRDNLNGLGTQQMAIVLLDQKLDAHEHDESSLCQTGKRVTIGFAMLAASVVLVAIRAFL